MNQHAKDPRSTGATNTAGCDDGLIEHQARVVAVDGDDAWVEAERTSACGGCSAGDACGVSALSKIIRLPSARLRVPRRLNGGGSALEAGDEVTVAVPEATLRLAALWAYLLPLVLLLLGASAGQLLFGSDPAAIVGAVIAPLLGVPLMRLRGSAISTQVLVLKRTPGAPEGAVCVPWPQKSIPLAARAAGEPDQSNPTYRI